MVLAELGAFHRLSGTWGRFTGCAEPGGAMGSAIERWRDPLTPIVA